MVQLKFRAQWTTIGLGYLFGHVLGAITSGRFVSFSFFPFSAQVSIKMSLFNPACVHWVFEGTVEI